MNLEHPDEVAEVVDTVTGLRRRADPAMDRPFDIAVACPPGTDPAPYAAAGATWWLTDFSPEAVSVDEVRGVLGEGPPAR